MFGKKKYYAYIGQEDLGKLSSQGVDIRKIKMQEDVLNWVQETNQNLDEEGTYRATFVLAQDSKLYITDHLTDHVLMTQGKQVLSAGEVSFTVEKNEVMISAIFNHSIGYCPEPESWKLVQKALKKARIIPPSAFTTGFVYRRCEKCDTINIVKEDWFVCAICDTELNKTWNIS